MRAWSLDKSCHLGIMMGVWHAFSRLDIGWGSLGCIASSCFFLGFRLLLFFYCFLLFFLITLMPHALY